MLIRLRVGVCRGFGAGCALLGPASHCRPVDPLAVHGALLHVLGAVERYACAREDMRSKRWRSAPPLQPVTTSSATASHMRRRITRVSCIARLSTYSFEGLGGEIRGGSPENRPGRGLAEAIEVGSVVSYGLGSDLARPTGMGPCFWCP